MDDLGQILAHPLLSPLETLIVEGFSLLGAGYLNNAQIVEEYSPASAHYAQMDVHRGGTLGDFHHPPILLPRAPGIYVTQHVAPGRKEPFVNVGCAARN